VDFFANDLMNQIDSGIIVDRTPKGTPNPWPEEIVFGTPGGFVDHVPVIGPDIEAVNVDSFFGDYYYRIWISPQSIRLSNPTYDTPIAFFAWNAYPYVNSMASATTFDLDGVELLFTPPVAFDAYEFKTLYFQITQDAPAQLDGRIEFSFTYGSGELAVFATLIEIIRALPKEPVKEVWTWRTVINRSENGKEQRTALRDQPRVSISFGVALTDNDERRTRFKQLFSFMRRSIRIPYFQYLSDITAPAISGDTKLYFDPTVTDLRVGEYAAIFDRRSRLLRVVKVLTVDADGATLDGPLDAAVSTDCAIMPTIESRMPNGSGLTMDAVNGDTTVAGESLTHRSLLRPAHAGSVPTFDSYPVLGLRPLALRGVDEEFDGNLVTIDVQTSNPQLVTSWDMAFFSGERQWKIDRDTDMDFWRLFLHDLYGQQNPFLLPTFRDDFDLLENPAVGSSFFDVLDNDIADYFAHETYKRIQIELESGEILYRKILSVNDVGGGTYRITMTSPLGSDEGDNLIKRVSWLNVVRLNNDQVELDHSLNWTIISLDIRQVNQ
jgi:hypothetical protein